MVEKIPVSCNKDCGAGWDEALDLVAEKLINTRKNNGTESVMRIGGSGSCRGALHNTATHNCCSTISLIRDLSPRFGTIIKN